MADLHGHPELFDAALEHARAELQTQSDEEFRVVTCGDYVDKGPAIPSMLERLIEYKERHPDTFHPIAGDEEFHFLLPSV